MQNPVTPHLSNSSQEPYHTSPPQSLRQVPGGKQTKIVGPPLAPLPKILPARQDSFVPPLGVAKKKRKRRCHTCRACRWPVLLVPAETVCSRRCRLMLTRYVMACEMRQFCSHSNAEELGLARGMVSAICMYVVLLRTSMYVEYMGISK